VLPSSWWADEMLGRLTRYLRMVGVDTAYETGLSDDVILVRSAAEGRRLVTRDHALARRARSSVLLLAVGIEQQWRELKVRVPELPEEPTFARCTLCNGLLHSVSEVEDPRALSGPAQRVRESGQPLYRCDRCGHVYWEGSHTASVRRRLAAWSRSPAP
jgi:uncharacterized protein